MQQLLPPGLIDNSIELFTTPDGVLMAIYQGSAVPFADVPATVKAFLRDEMLANEDVMAQFDKIGVALEDDQVYVYAKCLYGGYNHEADFDGYALGAHDNHACGGECQCVLKQVVKHVMPVANGYLTAREMDVVRLIAANFSGKQIADVLEITEHTVDKHKQNIFRKTGLTTNVDVAVWAFNNHLL